MDQRFRRAAIAAFGGLVVGVIGACSAPSAAPAPRPTTVTVAPPAPPTVTVTQPAPNPVPTSQQPSASSRKQSSSRPYENCRWDDSIGWFCRYSAEGGYFDVPDSDPGIGECAGQTWQQCRGSGSSSSGSGSSSGYSGPSSYSISSSGMAWLSSNWPTLYSAVASGDSSAVSRAISNSGSDPSYHYKIMSQFKANYPSDAAKLGIGG